jgi:hypothetical protein
VYNSSGSCYPYLSKWQLCANVNFSSDGNVNGVHVNGTYDVLQIKENEVSNLLRNINGSSNCYEVIVPFVCQYMFPLCSSDKLFVPSREICVNVSTGGCQQQWEDTINKSSGVSLPDCSKLPSAQNDTIVCADMFYKGADGLCLPKCDEFDVFDSTTTEIIIAIVIFSASVGLLLGISVFFISLFRYKSMCTFPSVLLIYMTLAYCIIATFILISLTDRSKLFCLYDNLRESLVHPSPYCTITGVVFHYFLFNLTLWWFFHVFSVFCKLSFPLAARRFKKYDKIVHGAMFLFGMLLPLPGVLCALFIDGLEYIMIEFPPLVCITRSEILWYYSTVLPSNILLCTGAVCFVIMFWIVRKHQGLFRYNKKYISGIEMKLLVVLFYFIIFGVVSLVHYSIADAQQDEFINGLNVYFDCQSTGLVNGTNDCDPYGHYQRLDNPYFKSIAYIMMGLVPIVNFVFVVQWKAVWDAIKSRISKKKYSHHNLIENDETTVAAVYHSLDN